MYPLWINVVGFQAGWWACILGAAGALEIPSIAFAFGLAITHLRCSATPRADLQLAAVGLLIGIAVDTLLQYFSAITFYGWALGPLSPFWLWALWVLFSLTLNASLAFLKNLHWGVSALAGLVFGPLTYHAGVQLGAASMQTWTTSMLCIALAWMVVLPLMVYLAQNKFHTTRGDA